MKFGYMGLASEYQTTWSDGRNVIVYPDGSVIDTNRGDYIRYADNMNAKPSMVQSPAISGNSDKLLIFGLLIVGIVAIVAISKR